MSARNEDFLFAQEAQSLGYVSEEQVEEGFLLQKKMAEDLKIDERLSVILVKRGWLAEEQAKRVLDIVEPRGARGQIEGYRLVQMVGRGAMGTVYKAIHKGLHRVVAIKILRRDLATDKTQVERLKREAKLLADLDHPNIVRAFDAGESNGFPYLVMEYVEGETLRERIAREGGMSNEEALRITRALADALEKARRMGVVHRDVKPGNVLISTSGTPKLMDLGLAKGPLDLGLTQQGATVGTPQFISPEQAQDPRKADTRSDIYSLGASLYAMMTTRPPFEGSTLAEIITKVLYEQPVPPRMRNPEVSPEVGHLIERMMLKDPTLRYQTPAQVVADIDMIRGGQSIVPTGFQGNWEGYLLRQRNRKVIRRSAIGIAAAVVLTIFGYAWWGRVQREEAQARVDTLASKILGMERATAGSTSEQLTEWLATATKESKEIEQLESKDGAHCTDSTRIEKLLDGYKSNLKQMGLVRSAEQRNIDPLLKEGNFQHALRIAQSYVKKNEAQDVSAARHLAEQAVARVEQASDARWASAREDIEKRTVRDLPGFVTKWKTLETAAKAPYAGTGTFRDEAKRATALGSAATLISEEIHRLDAAFAEAAVAERIRRLELMELRDDLSLVSDRARSAIAAHHEPFRTYTGVPVRRLTGPGGLAELEIRRIRERLEFQVDTYWQVLKKLVPSLPVDEALARLKAFEDAADRGDAFPNLAKEAGELAERVDKERYERGLAAQDAFEGIVDAVLRDLRRGDPQELRRAIASALDKPELDRVRRRKVQALVTGAEALEALQEAAFIFLENAQKAGTRLSNVERRGADGAVVVDKRWNSFEVDRDNRLVRAKVTRRISPSGTLVVPIGDFTLGQLDAWATRSGVGLTGLYLELIRLAEIKRLPHDDPGKDLRPLIQHYGLVLERIVRVEQPGGAWGSIVRGMLDKLTTYQRHREERARFTNASVESSYPLDKWLLTLGKIEALSAESGKLRHTNVFDKHRPGLETMAKVSRRALAEEELLRLVPGADVDKLQDGAQGSGRDGRHLFRFDFNDETQLVNFARGLGRLVPQKGGAITPVGLMQYRLMLLDGVRGLVRDRPLAIQNMMDPHARIVVELELETQGRGSFMVAFDIDGVQMAVCSADPNYWKWRFPFDAPLLADEDVLPEFNFYGRGRGVTFHDGLTFGPRFPVGNDWDWPAMGQGRHFERWKDSEFLAKRRSQLFAFEPGRKYRVKIVRIRGEMQFWVDGDMIAKKHDPDWTHKGHRSDIDKLTRGGSGLIQILTWTPMAIDNLSIEGKVMDTWRRLQQARRNKPGKPGK